MFDEVRTILQPLQEPLDLDEVKLHLRMDDVSDPVLQQAIDVDLMRRIRSVRERCEGFTRQTLITSTIEIWFSNQDGTGYFELPSGPIQSIESIEVFEPFNATPITLDTDTYQLGGDIITLADMLPYHREQRGIKIIAIAGFGDDPEDVPALAREGMLELLTYAYMRPDGAGATAKYEVEARLNGGLPQQVAAKWKLLRKVTA